MDIGHIESAIHKFTKDVSLGEDVIVSVINFMLVIWYIIAFSIFVLDYGAQMNWALIPRVKDWHKVSLKCSPIYLENL